MANFIIHNEGRYNIYSTVSDGPVFSESIDIDQLNYYIKEKYGTDGLAKLPERLARAIGKGTSSFEDESLEDTILCNRAGPMETELSFDDFVSQYLS